MSVIEEIYIPTTDFKNVKVQFYFFLGHHRSIENNIQLDFMPSSI